jgi:ferritin
MSDFKTYKNFKAVKELNEEEGENSTMDMGMGMDMEIAMNQPGENKTSTPTISMDAPIKPKTLDDVSSKLTQTLNKRIGDEYTAYFFYRNAANWCKGMNYNKAGEFFEAEAANELEHSRGLQDYLTQWNIFPTIPQAPTTMNFTSLIDVVNKAYEMEYGLLEKYSSDQKVFFDVHPATFNFIQKYVDFQNQEVAEYSDLLNALELIDINNKLDVLFFEKKYF